MGINYRRFITHIILIIASIISIYPIFWIITTSLKTKKQYLVSKIALPWPIHLSSIQQALSSANFIRWLFNSFFITFSAIILGLIISILAAYAITKLKFFGKELILNYAIALMAIPVIVMIIPLYILFSRINLVNTYTGMILIYTGITIPFSVYLLVPFFKSIPWEIIESSIIDGCNSFNILTKIIIPVSGPPIATLIIVNSLWIWNELLLALIFLPMDNTHTIMVGLTVHQSRFSINVPVVVSGLFISALPMLILYLALQRFFIRGLVSGSIKG
jgi:ABC-type glycerol-3-phosphate transport system permease component